MPPPGFTWIKVKEDVRFHGSKPLLEDSECLCPSGLGKIKIFLDEYEAFLAAENNSESGFVSEQYSSMALGIGSFGPLGPAMALLAPDLTEGVGRGIKKGAEGTWNFIKSLGTVQGWKDLGTGLGSMAVIGGVYAMNAQNPMGNIQSDMMLRSLDNRFGTSFTQTKDALVTGVGRSVDHAVENVKRGNWGEVGEDIGQIEYAVVEAVVGTKGAGLVVKGAKAATMAVVGAERLAQIAAASSRVMARMKSISGIVRIGSRVEDVFVGTLRGQSVRLPNVATRAIQYTKRAADELARLRNAFNSVRPEFLRDLANTPQKIARLEEAGFSSADIARIQSGRVPSGWQVHHKLPLDDGGTNNFDNLVLIQNEPYHKVLTNAQRTLVGDLTEGQTRTVDFPIPPGNIYPPRP